MQYLFFKDKCFLFSFKNIYYEKEDSNPFCEIQCKVGQVWGKNWLSHLKYLSPANHLLALAYGQTEWDVLK